MARSTQPVASSPYNAMILYISIFYSVNYFTVGKDNSVSLGVTNAMMTLQLDEEQGYYTLGEVTMDTAVYILSVTITSARRLSQVCVHLCYYGNHHKLLLVNS